MNNHIPPITDPMGAVWEQPKSDDIALDDTHALMSNWSLSKLAEYSHSIPSGVYDGKMWKRRVGDDWLLCWFSPHANPKTCSINYREILIA